MTLLISNDASGKEQVQVESGNVILPMPSQIRDIRSVTPTASELGEIRRRKLPNERGPAPLVLYC